jgi:hypothetical protein
LESCNNFIVQFFPFVPWPSDGHGTAADPEAKVEHIIHDIAFPFVRSKATAALVIFGPSKEKKSSDDAIVQKVLDSRTDASNSIVVHKATVAVGGSLQVAQYQVEGIC